jgi:uncharacterized membrane protein
MAKQRTLFLVRGAAIAALYAALTVLSSLMGLASGAVQVRLSEALTVLPALTPAAVPGLFIGCLLANLLTGCLPWDIVLGSLATLLGALGTYSLRRKPALAPLPPILANTLIVPLILSRVYGIPGTIPYLMLTVGAGEAIACGVLGTLLLAALSRHPGLFSTAGGPR